MSTSDTLDIAIAGAGIGGLGAAAMLARAGHAVTVFDQFDAPRPVGSGLVIQPVGAWVLDQCGAGDAARAMGAPLQRMLGYEVTGSRRVLDVSYDKPGGAAHGLGIHRAALFSVLWDAALAAGATVVPSSEVQSLPLQEGKRTVKLTSGATHGPYDLVIDAAGAGSELSPLVSKPLAYGAIWGTVPWPDATGMAPDQLSQRYEYASRMVGILPIGAMPGDSTLLAAVFWSLPEGGYDRWRAAPLAEWKAEATRLWPEMAPFLEQIQSHEDMTLAQYTHGTLRRPIAERLAHIGDAAHRASPQLGQGANMALLDAFALAYALAETGNDIPAALDRYARSRRWHVQLYQSFSAVFTPQYQSDSRLLPWLRDRVMMPISKIPPVPRLLTKLVAGNLIPPVAGQVYDKGQPKGL